MPGTNGELGNGVGTAMKRISEHASSLVKLEVELARLEVTKKLGRLGRAAVLGGTAAILALFGLGFALAGGAAGLAETLPTWLAILIVAGALLVTAGLLGLLAARAAKRGVPPVPKQAIEEARLTREAIKDGGGS